ncbi:MerR family transcriptional regulator [Hoeflea sp. BAL378]|uniref:MerR family transcriptional regulator n=1 Tax=Hoeflea sp. BAL378 TaxID=1547437 RepID=UPI0005137C14|nr:MerR family transcriptional regulator [Hoeflea sp. BAL378]KGF67612.1 MerR family transcriptional regulator [Hoeflea sp. BAL378]
MKIGRLSELTGLSIDTLRYYEKIGLIDPPYRAGGQRLYDPDAVRWIDFLKALKATGMSLEDMKRYALMRARGNATAANRRVMLEKQHATVLARMAELQACAALLEHKIANYHEIEAAHERADRKRTVK